MLPSACQPALSVASWTLSSCKGPGLEAAEPVFTCSSDSPAPLPFRCVCRLSAPRQQVYVYV